MADHTLKRYVLQAATASLLLFALLYVYVAYVAVWQGPELAQNPLNQRGAAARADITRGTIVDCNGVVLAETKPDGVRYYTMGEAMAPVTGYNGERIGSAGIEGTENRVLLGLTEDMSRIGPISQLFQSDRGNDVKLTIDSRLQKIAYDELDGQRGAILVMDAQTGAILAMASAPSYDPNQIEAEWKNLNAQSDGPLLNRAVQGMYPPGSSIKPMIADAALTDGITTESERFDCNGILDVGGGFSIHDYNGEVHGQINLRQALTESCNVTFGTLGMRLGDDRLKKAYERFGFTETLMGDVVMERAHLPSFGTLAPGDQAQSAIGQSTLLVTPMQMLLLADAYANNGKVMRPYLVDSVISANGVVLSKALPEVWRTVTTPDMASTIDSYMADVVKSGTGKLAATKGVRVTGKTGTAENGQGKDHAWFIGSAKLPMQKIVFAIIIEHGGSGGRVAAPVAKRLIQTMLMDT